MSDFDVEQLKESYRIDELENVYDEYYSHIEDSEFTEEEQVCGTIYATVQTVGMPVIYGEFEHFDEVDSDNLQEIVSRIEQAEDMDDGELSEENVWDYVFMDLNTGNVTAHVEHMARQLVEYYKQSDEFKQVVDEFDKEVASASIIYMMRNSTPDATGAANHIEWENTPQIHGENSNYDKYDVIEAYHNIFEKPDIAPSLKYNVIDDTGVMTKAINILEKLDISEEKKDSIYYLLYDINATEEYNTDSVATIVLDELTDISLETLIENSTTSEAEVERIREKINTDFLN